MIWLFDTLFLFLVIDVHYFPTCLQESPVAEEEDVKYVVGHRFTSKDSQNSKHYCEKCMGLIWGVLQAWYRCASKYDLYLNFQPDPIFVYKSNILVLDALTCITFSIDY